MSIRRHLIHNRAFAPDDIAILSTAFEGALHSLQLVDRADPAVSLVAERIIELAFRGERDPILLRDRVLESFSKGEKRKIVSSAATLPKRVAAPMTKPLPDI